MLVSKVNKGRHVLKVKQNQQWLNPRSCCMWIYLDQSTICQLQRKVNVFLLLMVSQDLLGPYFYIQRMKQVKLSSIT